MDYGRCFTLVYYLNSNWKEYNGGALRIYLPPEEPSGEARRVVEVFPHGDTFVLFRADRCAEMTQREGWARGPVSARCSCLAKWLT